MYITPHKPILIKDLTITFGNKNCITDPFSNTIYYGNRIAVIGRNGSGKTSLIKALFSNTTHSEDNIIVPDDISIGYVPQLINDNDMLSGGQKFNQRLSAALALQPNLLLLDEPTNHLDAKNRRALMSMLKRYPGTLILVTHDIELLTAVNTIWHVDNGSITVFNGRYDEYLEEQKHKKQALESAVKGLNYQKIQAHEKLMQEQHRAKNSKVRGEKYIEQRKWPTVRSVAKMNHGITTAVNNKARIEHNKQNVIDELQNLYVPEVLIPKFNLNADTLSNKTILNISNGSIGYDNQLIIVSDINITLSGAEKAVIHGNNASGKSTTLKAILGNANINKSGIWLCPNVQNVGYLDQGYSQLNSNKTAVELVSEIAPQWCLAQVRDHLNSFLLRKNEEVNLVTSYLSGGEKVRLSLALIAAKPPKLLLLDEITNNIDLETKEHLIQVLNAYPGAFILICHEQEFVARLAFTNQYQIQDGKFNLC